MLRKCYLCVKAEPCRATVTCVITKLIKINGSWKLAAGIIIGSWKLLNAAGSCLTFL